MDGTADQPAERAEAIRLEKVGKTYPDGTVAVAELDLVTPADLLRVARRWVRPDQARLAVLGPFRGRSRFTRALRQWQPA